MRQTSWWLVWVLLRACVWTFRAPIVLALGVVRVWVANRALGDTAICSTCLADIQLLGLWQCGRCGYSWHGWYFARCEICGDVPAWVECDGCGASTMNPSF